MPVCRVVAPITAAGDAGMALRPTVTAIRTSCIPRVFSALSTFIETRHLRCARATGAGGAREPSGKPPGARWRAVLCTSACSRIFARSASKHTGGSTGSRGRDCQAVTPGSHAAPCRGPTWRRFCRRGRRSGIRGSESGWPRSRRAGHYGRAASQCELGRLGSFARCADSRRWHAWQRRTHSSEGDSSRRPRTRGAISAFSRAMVAAWIAWAVIEPLPNGASGSAAIAGRFACGTFCCAGSSRPRSRRCT